MGDLEFDVAIFDDAHILDEYHFDTIRELIENQDKKIILSTDKNYDAWQHGTYKAYNGLMKNDWSISYDLSNKIRTSLEIVAFMSCVFNKKKQAKKLSYNNIELSFFSSSKDIKKHIASLKTCGWQDFYLSSSNGDLNPSKDINTFKEKTLKKELEEDFEKVAVVMDNSFVYNEEGKLVVASKSNYQAPMVLHKIMTRATKKIHFIILDNEPLFEHFLDIIDADTMTLKG